MVRNQLFIRGKSRSERKVLSDVIELGLDFINGSLRNQKVVNYKNIKYFFNKYGYPVPLKGRSLGELLKKFREIGEFSVGQSDIHYMAFPDSGNSLGALAGDLFSKFLNQNLISYDRGSQVGTVIEMQLIEWLRQLVGFEYKSLTDFKSLGDVSGMWTTGGHLSNHIGILTALNNAFPEIKAKGLGALGFSPKMITSTDISHYSEFTAMHHLGLGRENVIKARVNSDFTTDCDHVEQLLSNPDIRKDVFIVVAIAGNSRTSNIDNIQRLGVICNKYGIWLHVDACHGGSLLFSERLHNKYLCGIEMADSISLDPHKGLFVTYPSSYILFKRRDALIKFASDENLVREGNNWDLGLITPFFGSRGFESLKLWSLITHIGLEELSRIVEERHENAIFFSKMIDTSSLFCPLHNMSFYRYSFVFFPKELRKFVLDSNVDRYVIKRLLDKFTNRINQEIYEEGKICFDEFKLLDIGNRTSLSIFDETFFTICVTIGNPLHTKGSLIKTYEILEKKAMSLLPEFERELNKIINLESVDVQVVKTSGPASWY